MSLYIYINPIPRPSKIYQKWKFWYANIVPSGNTDFTCIVRKRGRSHFTWFKISCLPNLKNALCFYTNHNFLYMYFML
jgi:hypothetical protein